MEGIGPEQLRLSSLLERASNPEVKEVILATNPTVEGDTTALYIQRLLSQKSGLKVTRLASGIPVGGDLEYADRLTLARSFRGRTSFLIFFKKLFCTALKVGKKVLTQL